MKSNQNAVRISLSIPRDLADNVDALARKQGSANRSVVVADILRQALIEDRRRDPQAVMAGSITLFYQEDRLGLAAKVAAVQRRFLKEVVSSLHVLLENTMSMEVLVVQGPVIRLEELCNGFRQIKGVETGSLTLTGAVLPPLHQKTQGASL